MARVDEIDVRCWISVIPTEEGGRRTPFVRGYRPQLHLIDENTDWDTSINELPAESMSPGDTGKIGFSLLSWERLKDRLYIGMEFQLREGSRVIAYGVVTWLRTSPPPLPRQS